MTSQDIKKIKRFVLFGILSFALFVGCGKQKNENGVNKSEVEKSNSAEEFKTSAVVENQFGLPEKGEKIAVLEVENYGTIKIRLFEKAAPKTVKRFIEIAEKGGYDNDRFDKVVDDFLIQTGEKPEKDYKEGLPIEVSPSLHCFNGAVCAAKKDDDFKNGQFTQFFIVSSSSAQQISDYNDFERRVNEENSNKGLKTCVKFDENLVKTYKERGGMPQLEASTTVFGQVIEGMEVVKKIQKCEKVERTTEHGEDEVPEHAIVLKSVRVENF